MAKAEIIPQANELCRISLRPVGTCGGGDVY